MKTWKLLTGAFALALAFTSCELGTPPTTVGGGTEVNGVAVDFRGAPVSHAWIRVFPDSAPGLGKASASFAAVRDSARTDALGRYRFRNLPSGDYALLASATRNDTMLAVLIRGIRHTGGSQNLETVVLQLGGVISLRVNSGASPLSGAQCSIAGVPLTVVVSDSSGTCRLAGLPQGSFRITISYPGLGSTTTAILNVTAGQVTLGGYALLGGDSSGTAPATPTPWSPTNNSVISGASATLAWNHPDSLDVLYRVQVAQDSTFLSPVLDTVLDAKAFDFAMQTGTSYHWRVSAQNAFGSSGYSAKRRFSQGGAPSAPPPTPTQTGPANGAVLQDSATLIWSASASATSYHLQVSTDSLFSNVVYEDANLTVTAHTMITVITGGSVRYYWRVRARNAVGVSAFSGVRPFVISAFPSGLIAPALYAPANGGLVVDSFPLLTWEARSGALGYRVQVSLDSTFATLALTLDTQTTATSLSRRLTNSGTHFWRVNATYATGASAFSPTRNFRVEPLGIPALSAPTNGASGVSSPVTLGWGGALNATTYDIHVSTAANFSVLTAVDTMKAPLFVTKSLSAGTYYWRVRARNGATVGSWSASRSFSTSGAADTTLPAAPSLLSPANGATNQSRSLPVTWAAASSATSYHLQVSTSAGFSTTVVNDSTATSLSRSLTGLAANQAYHWRVRGRNHLGPGPWSSAFSFTTVASVDSIAPGTPVLASPVNNATGVSTPVLLAWDFTDHATRYVLHVATDSAFTTLAHADSTTELSRTVSLPGGASYYWRVRAKNGTTNGSWAARRRFTTAP